MDTLKPLIVRVLHAGNNRRRDASKVGFLSGPAASGNPGGHTISEHIGKFEAKWQMALALQLHFGKWKARRARNKFRATWAVPRYVGEAVSAYWIYLPWPSNDALSIDRKDVL